MKKKIITHIKETFKLAIPSAVARAGILIMGVTDTIMVSRYSSVELASFGMANSFSMFFLVVLISLATGIPVVCSHQYGSGQYKKCVDTWLSSLPYCLILSLISMSICFMGKQILILLGQDYDLASRAGEVAKVFAYSFPWIMIYACCAGFLEGIKRPTFAMFVVFIANILNVFFNWVFIYGKFGFPAMGAVGASWSTVAERFIIAIIMILYIFPIIKHQKLNFKKAFKIFDKTMQKMRRIGYGSAFSKGSELFAFFVVTALAGRLGTMPLASFSIAMNFINLFYMISAGFAAAAAVRVGIAYGKQSSTDVALAGWIAILINLFVMLSFSFLILLFDDAVTLIYTNDEILMPLAKKAIGFSSWVIIISGSQIVAASSLRGRGDILIPAAVQAVCYIFIMTFSSWFLSFKFELGIIGLLFGMMIASFLSTMFLATRFKMLSKKDYVLSKENICCK